MSIALEEPGYKTVSRCYLYHAIFKVNKAAMLRINRVSVFTADEITVHLSNRKFEQ